MLRPAAVAMAAVATVTACAASAREARRAPLDAPVPRFETLRFPKVYGRSGPSRDHAKLWVYAREGMPMEVVAETSEWRRVRDPDGSESWVHRSQLSSRRAVMVRFGAAAGIDLLAQPQAGAPVRAVLASGVIGALEECDGGWCRITVARRTGWAAQRSLWGVFPGERVG